MYVYYPSCNFQKFFPETAARVCAYLEGQGDVRIAGCCHATYGLPSAGDTIVTVCMSCMRGLDELRPDVPQISLFEFLFTRTDFPWPDLGGEGFTLQDCFRARCKRGLQDAVRTCLERANARVIEMPHNRDEETFDGSFLLHDPYPQNLREAPDYFGVCVPQFVTALPEEKWTDFFREHAKLYSPGRVVGYCNTCVRSAREGGADAAHLAELLFP